ncbi:MAG: AsmA family protein, partial [Rhodospirillales bacterium]
MKKIVWGLSIVVLIIVGVIVVGPSIIDWNAYKDDVSQKVKVLTGRDLKISGDVQVTLFPAPTIIANDVSFSNMQGAAT